MTASFDMLAPIIGDPDHLSDEHAIGMAQRVADMLATSPDAVMLPSISGYDDDPRELYQIPEVCEYVLKFCGACEALGVPVWTWNTCNDVRSWIAGCLWPASEIGERLFQLNRKQQAYLGYDVKVTDQYKSYKGVPYNDDSTC